MNFEQEAIQYLDQIIINGEMLTGSIVGVSEIHLFAKGVGTFTIDNSIVEKYFAIKKINGNLTWYFLNPVDANEASKEPGDWSYPIYAKRIVAPIGLIMEDIGIKMYGWFQINSLPVVTVNNTVHLYCNVILPEHQTIIDSLQGIISIEDRPEL